MSLIVHLRFLNASVDHTDLEENGIIFMDISTINYEVMSYVHVFIFFL